MWIPGIWGTWGRKRGSSVCYVQQTDDGRSPVLKTFWFLGVCWFDRQMLRNCIILLIGYAVLSICFAQQRAMCSTAKNEASLTQVKIFFFFPQNSPHTIQLVATALFTFSVLQLCIKLTSYSFLPSFCKTVFLLSALQNYFCVYLIGNLQLIIL